MSRHLLRLNALLLMLGVASGCLSHKTESIRFIDRPCYPPSYETQLELEDPRDVCRTADPDDGPPPVILSRDWPPQFSELTLQQAVQVTLQNSEVLRDMGGLVLRAPGTARTVHDPAVTETDPRFGVDAALSAFDASFAASAFFQNNDRPLNNLIEGLGTNLFRQDLGNYNLELSKRTALGTRLSLRHIIDYNFNSSPANADPNLPWSALVEGEIRQPLLQGAGVNFNRIAGVNGVPGFNNGVLLARINTDISLTEFEVGVRDLVSNVENAYWELYFAYRDLDSKLAARNQALETWETIRKVRAAGKLDAERETLAEEQYYRLESEVQNAIAGRVVEKSNSNVFRGTGGVLFHERRLRRAMGLPANDGQLLRPSSEPPLVDIRFNWDEVRHEAIARRPELRRQQWEVVRLENELIAARNYLKPRLDAIARYRFRGIGQHLINSEREGRPAFDNAYANLTSGDYQEWEMGVEYSIPIGFRQAHTAVRNAELRLARSRAVLHEQEDEVVNDLSTAIAEADRAFHVAKTNYNRRTAAYNNFLVVKNSHDEAIDLADKLRLLTRLLEAQRRLADADAQFYRALSEYAFALKQVHFEKGSLLDYNEIVLSEAGWPHRAYHDASKRNARYRVAGHLDRKVHRRLPPVSNGPHPQSIEPAIAAPPTNPMMEE